VVLVRWYLWRSKWLTICLHRFLKTDPWDPHNHDYDSASLILWGRYTEVIWRITDWPLREITTARRRLLSFHRRTAHEFHRIIIPIGYEGRTWSLFFQYRFRPRDFVHGYLDAWGSGSFVPLERYGRARGRAPDRLVLRGRLFPRIVVSA
jgi:hypothetical protein